MKRILIVLLSLCLIFPECIFAKSKYITTGNNVVMNDNYDNTHIVFGNRVDVFNQVNGVYTVFGENINYNSDNNYLLMFANELNISGRILDGAIFGNEIDLSNINVDRDIVIFGNEIELSGNYKGNVVVFGSDVSVDDALIAGNLITYCGVLTIDDSSRVLGTLKFTDDTVTTIETNDIGMTTIIKDESPELSSSKRFLDYVYNLVSLLVIFLVLYLIVPSLFDNFSNKIGKNFLVGAISFICLPVILLILLFTNFATSVSIIGILFYIIVIMLSKVLVGYIVGDFIWNKLIKKTNRKYLCGLLGITIVYILSIIPFIGGLVTFVTLLYSFGIIINLILDYRRK